MREPVMDAGLFTFQGRDEAEALACAEAVLGPGCQVLESRLAGPAGGPKAPRGARRAARPGGEGVEIVASGPEAASRRFTGPAAPAPAEARPRPERERERERTGPVLAPGQAVLSVQERLAALEERVLMGQERSEARFDELRRLLLRRGRGAGPRVDDAWLDLHGQLVDGGLPPETAQGLVEECAARQEAGEEAADRRARLLEALAARLAVAQAPPAKPVEPGPRVMAFVGPPGMGKSTVAQKAAFALFREGPAKLALVEVDPDHRPRTSFAGCARLLALPHAVVASLDQARETARHFAEAGQEAVLVDTPGQCPGDSAGLARLAQWLSALKAREVHLVLGADMDLRAAARALEDYRPLRASRWVLSRMDCAGRYPLLSLGIDLGGLAEAGAAGGGEAPQDVAGQGGGWAYFASGTAPASGWTAATPEGAARWLAGFGGQEPEGALDGPARPGAEDEST